jgi:hypothetical protein
MRIRSFAAVVTGVLALVVGGCAQEDPAGTAAQATQATQAEPASGVCDEVPECDVVANADVDGDGVADEVGFVVQSRREVVVHVKTAAGQSLQHPLEVMWFPRGEFYGAAPIDGRPGAELVVGTNMGAHTLFFTTLSVQDGRIVQLDAPGGDDEWMVDGAFSFQAGVTRRVEDGQAVVVLSDAARRGHRSAFAGRDRTFVWTDAGWEHRSTTRRRYRGEESVLEVGGWHVEGLPRFPEV